MLLSCAAALLLVLAPLSAAVQPKAIVTVEAGPARKAFDAMIFPEGSIWCGGKPTVWFVGVRQVHCYKDAALLSVDSL